MAKRIKLSEASKFVFEISSDDDTCSESSYSPDSEDCSETSYSESEDTLWERDDDAAAAQPSTSRDPPQNDPQSNTTHNYIIGINPQLLLYPSFPLMTTSHANLLLKCLLHYTKLTLSKFSVQKVCVYLLRSVQTKELTCITSKKML